MNAIPDLFAEQYLLAKAVSLGAFDIPEWSSEERELVEGLQEWPESKREQANIRGKLASGIDLLGDEFRGMRPASIRRTLGATYTPLPIVDAMVRWAAATLQPSRIVDPGVGSGRFLVAAGRTFPNATLVGIDVDPVATILARANLAVSGMGNRAAIHLGKYQDFLLPQSERRTLFIGNPPYVRHHVLSTHEKDWLTAESSKLGFSSSQLAGLHVHFILATALKACPGDYGAFITSAEWLDVNYGKLVRDLLLGPLGGQSVTLIEPTVLPFEDASTTAAICTFQIGSKATSLFFRRLGKLDDLGSLEGGRRIRRERLVSEQRWSHFTRTSYQKPAGYIELGELCRVHRGQVTGANRVWIAGPLSADLPASVLFPSVTRAKELFDAGSTLADDRMLKRVIDLPFDLDSIDHDERVAVERFLKRAKELNAHQSYVAKNRKSWWSVGLHAPAPILATYMARRPPAFVINAALVRHINIAHGLYPRDPMSDALCSALCTYLSRETQMSLGRTYSGGLTKFEPREMERIPVPPPAELLRLNA
ncbi:MAG: N-6 DNA methylase [FCB group bacterium]|jgi:hypothetical protein|nr:N-6 DNA methylase [FCB group bacterium]